MLSTTARPFIEATTPVLLAHGEAITRHFYQRMFQHHPELLNLFNLGNQASGGQAQALAGAVYAFAMHMDQPDQIGPVLERIAHKHVSLGIAPAQYTVVGRHLLAAIGEVLGDAITPDIARAWDEVYWLMASELIAREARLYQALNWQAGSWLEAVVLNKEQASEDTVALTLGEATGAPLPSFLPGQYVSVALPLPDAGLTQVRQYSFSNAPGDGVWRITVKRVDARGDAPAGMVSGRIHSAIEVGDRLRVGPPAGEFCLREGEHPVVLISAGVGVTPMIAMLKHIERTQPGRPVTHAHAATDEAHQPHRAEIEQILRRLPNARSHVWLEAPGASAAVVRPGRMDLGALRDLPQDADHFLCGPLPFMQQQRRALIDRGVEKSRIHCEVFGPELLGSLR